LHRANIAHPGVFDQTSRVGSISANAPIQLTAVAVMEDA
jgi:hypothetical protein